MGRVQSVVLGVVFLAAMAPAAQGQTRGGFDSSGHLLMHGTPRFVLGVFDSGLGYAPDPAFWEDAIFSPTGSRGLQGLPLNVYLNYFLGGMPIESTTALLDVLHVHGLMYLQTGNCFADGSWTRFGATGFSIADQSYVQQFAQHPAALGYYIMDECDDALIPETQQHYQQLKSWDPQGISLAVNVAAAYRDPALWVNAADILAIDPYPLYGAEPAQGYPHFVVADFTARVRAAAPATRPTWTVLQFFKFTTDSRLPTAQELRAHAVMAVVEGAQGLFWWELGVNGLRQLDAGTVSTYMSYLKTLTTELSGLEPALLAAPADSMLTGNTTRFSDPVAGRIAQLQHNIAVETVFSRVQADQAEIAALQAGDTSKSPLLAGAANVRTRTKMVNGVGFVFAYNYTNQPQAVTFTWQRAPTSVRESTSGQSFTLSGASWSDTFGPYEARIYVVNAPAFDYTLANGGPISVVQGGSGATSITATLQSGTGQGVALAASGLPGGATASFSEGTCTPTCASSLTISTSGSTPIGTVPITVTGSPFSKTTTFSLVVKAPILTVAKAGTGSGTVTSGDGNINCGTICSETVASGTPVTLTATPTSNSTFTSWSGCLSTRGNTCTVTGATTVTATFMLTTGVTLTVTILGSGAGTVISIDGTINCGATCAALYNRGAAVTLTATGSSGATFKQWGGACSGTVPTCTITLIGSQSLTATFSESFTDGSGPNAALSAGSMVIKAAHILELRTAISNVRAVNGLGAFSWTDPALTVQSVVARRIHFLDLRTALAAVCTALPGKCMTYTDATLSAGHTVIKAVHLNELRANVRALE